MTDVKYIPFCDEEIAIMRAALSCFGGALDSRIAFSNDMGQSIMSSAENQGETDKCVIESCAIISLKLKESK